MDIQNTTIPYKEMPYKPIQYTVCRGFNHISRYKGLRQVIHNPSDTVDRFIALETTNPLNSDVPVLYYEVLPSEVNRLDILADRFLGSAQYSWVLAYFNNIEDGFTVNAGQIIKFPENITSLFNKGELLASISAVQLNLGTE